MRDPTRRSAAGCAVLCTVATAWSGARGAEVTVQNDSITDGTSATICPCFVAGEQAAVWFTSPCDGAIVAVQVFWRSLLANQPDMIEDEITIRNPGTFPNPGTILETLAAPVLTDGVLNEFRFHDENQTIPLNVPVTSGQQFAVAFKFFNANAGTQGPSLVFDSDGATPGRNAIFAIPDGWLSNQAVGVTGDWFIRVVIDCIDTGACCFSDSTCAVGLTAGACASMSGVYLGGGSTCAGSPCLALPAACCIPATGGCVTLNQSDCANQVGGSWQGPGTTCPDACAAPPGCAADLDSDGDTDVLDFGIFSSNFGQSVPPNTGGDFDGDGVVTVLDFADFAADFGCTP